MKMASVCVLKATDCVCFPLLLWECCAQRNKEQTDLGTLHFVIAIIQCFSYVQLCAHDGIKQSQVKNVVLGTPQGQLCRGIRFFHFTCIGHAYIYIYIYTHMKHLTKKTSFILSMFKHQDKKEHNACHVINVGGHEEPGKCLPHVSSCCVELDTYPSVLTQAA